MTNVNFEIFKQNDNLKNKILYYQKYLPLLCKALNKIHNTSHNQKYWEIIIGPWLLFFISTVDFIYTQKKNLNKKKAGNFLIPYDYTSFVTLTYSNKFFNSLNLFVDKEKNKTLFKIYKNEAKKISQTKKLLKKFIFVVSKFFLPFFSIVTVDTYLSIKSNIKLILYSKFKILNLALYNSDNSQNFDVNLEMRKSLKLENKPFNKIDESLAKLIPFQIPYIHIEGYKKLLAKTPLNINKSRVIFSSTGWQENELFKLFCANSIKNPNSTLIGYQHGGYPYGMTDSPIAYLEKQLVDKYLTWGWSQDEKDIKLISIKISLMKSYFLKKRMGETIKDSLLFISTGGSNFFPDGFNVTTGNDWPEYYRDQKYFFKFLEKRIVNNTKIRLHPSDYLFDNIQRNNFKRINKNFKYDNNKNLKMSLLNTKLVIIDHLHTTFLETLGTGIPTIIFINELIWKPNGQFAKIFNKLKQANIIHTSPKSAASFINSNYSNLDLWWNSQDVKNVLIDLKKNFINLDRNPEKILAKKLISFS